MGNQIGMANENLENAAEAIEEFTSRSFWTKHRLMEVGTNFLKVILILLIGFIIVKSIIFIIKKIMKKSGANKSAVYYIEIILKFILYSILLTVAANKVGINTGSIIAFIASFGLALALALKGSLTDLASGIILILTKPILEGDQIFIENDDDLYEVEQIKLFDTYLKNRKKIVLVVPNGKLSQYKIKNLSQSDFVYTDIEVGVAYGSDLDLVKRVIVQTIREQKNVLQDQPISVGVKKLNQSSVDFFIAAPVSPLDFTATKIEMYEAIYRAFISHNIKIPFPQREVYLMQESSDNQR